MPLTQPVLGTLKVKFRTELSPQNPRPGESSLLDVPLAVPRDGRLIANLATVVAEPGLRVQPRGAAWQPASGSAPAGSAAGATIEPVRLTSVVAESVLPLAVSLGDRPLLGATFVDRAWVQTWLTETDCQERVVYQFTSGDEQESCIPPGIAAAGRDARSTASCRPSPARRENCSCRCRPIRRDTNMCWNCATCSQTALRTPVA